MVNKFTENCLNIYTGIC